jgi:Spirocyclase AveC-like
MALSTSVPGAARHAALARVSTGTWLWIGNGVFWFVFAVWVWGAWILGPDFKENAIGREFASAGYVRWIRAVEVISVLLFLWQIWYFILRPKLRTGRLSIDGLFFLACGMLYLQEPWINYNNHQFLYTTVSFNRGSWCGYVPGWNSPNPELIPVGSPIWATAYFTLVGLWVFCGAKFMAWWKSKRPDITPLELILTTFLVFIPFDFVLEYGILSTELFNYASTVPELTLWAGEKNQFPLYEIVSWCACLTTWTALRYFQNDKGETLAERGLSKIRFPLEGLKTFTRFLVITGACQVFFLLLYNIPYFYWSTKGAAFPDYAPYRIGGLCGPGTHYDCPSLTVPVAKKLSPTNRTVPVDDLPVPPSATDR